MRQVVNDILARFGPIPRKTETADTIITRLVPPYTGPLGASLFRYSIDNGKPNWFDYAGRTVITAALYTTAGTAHTVTLCRPFNFVRISEAVTANDTTVVIDKDPGVYSTNYNYPSPITTGTAAVANNAIAANDFVAFQLLDGTWHFSKVTSVSSLTITLTTATPNVTGGGAALNSPLFFFGDLLTDKDPATGDLNPGTLTIASTNRINQFDDDILGFASALHPGDPLVLHSGNATAAGSFEGISGYYAKL